MIVFFNSATNTPICYSIMALQDLTSKCVDGAVADNVEELVESSDWLDLSADCIESILKSSSLLVPHEFFLFEALLRWFINKRQTCEEKELIDFLRKVGRICVINFKPLDLKLF